MDRIAQRVLEGSLLSCLKRIPSSDTLQGYLDIVRWLCENGGAAVEVDGVRGVDTRSKGGWTPLSKSEHSDFVLSISFGSLVNAASKGHLPVVLYLLTKQSADPFVRNNWGETAYDVAAAVFEVWICEVSALANSRIRGLDVVPYRCYKRRKPNGGKALLCHIILWRSILQCRWCCTKVNDSTCA